MLDVVHTPTSSPTCGSCQTPLHTDLCAAPLTTNDSISGLQLAGPVFQDPLCVDAQVFEWEFNATQASQAAPADRTEYDRNTDNLLNLPNANIQAPEFGISSDILEQLVHGTDEIVESTVQNEQQQHLLLDGSLPFRPERLEDSFNFDCYYDQSQMGTARSGGVRVTPNLID